MLIFIRLSTGHILIMGINSSNEKFSQMIESVQYNAALAAFTCAIRGSSREKLYQELGFESLRDRRWYRKLCFYYKIRHSDCPLYLTECIPVFEPSVSFIRTERLSQHFSHHPLLVGTYFIQTLKILPPLKFLNEHYSNLFVLRQH